MRRSNEDRSVECRMRGNCPQRLRREILKEQSIAMKSTFKSVVSVSLILTSCVLSACSGPVGLGSGSGSGSGGGPFTISVTVSGLAGTGLVLADNTTDKLTITANGTSAFASTVAKGGSYAVTVQTQPSNPTQTCAASPSTASGSNISANVTATVSCTTNPVTATIGGTVSGLVVPGSSVILQNNGGDSLTVTANGSFTFKTPVTGADVYAVTVVTQPVNPNQICTVTNGSGVASANVTNVAIVCPAVTYSVGGRVVGLAGIPPNNGVLTDGSFLLQNNLGNTLNITENGPFTFATQEALNDQYQVSIFHSTSTQSQGCTLWNYKGVVTASVTGVVVDCAHNDWTWIDGTKTAGPIAAPQYGSFPASAPPTFPNPFTNTPGAR